MEAASLQSVSSRVPAVPERAVVAWEYKSVVSDASWFLGMVLMFLQSLPTLFPVSMDTTQISGVFSRQKLLMERCGETVFRVCPRIRFSDQFPAKPPQSLQG